MQPYVVSGAAWWQRGSCVTACILSLSKPRNIQQVKKIVINNLWGAVKHFNLSCISLYGGFHGSWEVIFFVLLNIYFLNFSSSPVHFTQLWDLLDFFFQALAMGKIAAHFQVRLEDEAFVRPWAVLHWKNGVAGKEGKSAIIYLRQTNQKKKSKKRSNFTWSNLLKEGKKYSTRSQKC